MSPVLLLISIPNKFARIKVSFTFGINLTVTTNAITDMIAFIKMGKTMVKTLELDRSPCTSIPVFQTGANLLKSGVGFLSDNRGLLHPTWTVYVACSQLIRIEDGRILLNIINDIQRERARELSLLVCSREVCSFIYVSSNQFLMCVIKMHIHQEWNSRTR